jgi:hypothetical protein
MATKLELVHPPFPPKSTRNVHGVPKKQWAKWGPAARQMFNHLYATMKDQYIFRHPKAEPVPAHKWKTVRWNAAWTGADFVNELSRLSPARA